MVIAQAISPAAKMRFAQVTNNVEIKEVQIIVKYQKNYNMHRI